MVVGWFFRQGFVFILIVAAIVFQQLVLPKILSGEIGSLINNERKSAETITSELLQYKQTSIASFENFQTSLHTQTENTIQKSLTYKKDDLATIKNDLEVKLGLFPPIRPDAILEVTKLKIDEKVVQQEINLLELALTESRERLNSLRTFIAPGQKKLNFARTNCLNANKAVGEFNKRLFRFPSEAKKFTDDANNKCKIYVSLNKKVLAEAKSAHEKLMKRSKDKITRKSN